MVCCAYFTVRTDPAIQWSERAAWASNVPFRWAGVDFDNLPSGAVTDFGTSEATCLFMKTALVSTIHPATDWHSLRCQADAFSLGEEGRAYCWRGLAVPQSGARRANMVMIGSMCAQTRAGVLTHQLVQQDFADAADVAGAINFKACVRVQTDGGVALHPSAATMAWLVGSVRADRGRG